jgi:hypothetical protein
MRCRRPHGTKNFRSSRTVGGVDGRVKEVPRRLSLASGRDTRAKVHLIAIPVSSYLCSLSSVPHLRHAIFCSVPLDQKQHDWTSKRQLPTMKKFYGLTGSRLNIAIAVIAGVDFALFGYDQVRHTRTILLTQSLTNLGCTWRAPHLAQLP